jgi:hypothetical protein
MVHGSFSLTIEPIVAPPAVAAAPTKTGMIEWMANAKGRNLKITTFHNYAQLVSGPVAVHIMGFTS